MISPLASQFQSLITRSAGHRGTFESEVYREPAIGIESSEMMYARLINLSFQQTVAHEDAHGLYQDLVTLFRQIEGFRGYSFMLMPNARRGVILTLWDDAACATQGGEVVMPMICERMSDLLAEAPDVTGYEVIDHVMIEAEDD